MGKQSGGMFAFITGAVMGAAAVFLAKKENREMAKKKLTQAQKTAEKLKKEIKDNPEKVKQDAVRAGKQIAQKVSKSIRKETVETKS